MVTSHENAERRMAEWRTAEPQGPITIAGSGLWHYYLLPTILADLLAAFPRLLPRLYSMLPAEVEERVAEGAVDVGLLLAPPQRPDLEALAGLETPYRIVGSPGSPSSWRECGFVVPRFFRREGATSLDGWPDHQYPRRVVAEAEMLESMVRLCEAGVGVAFLPELAVRDRIQRGSLVVIARAPVRHHDRLFVVRRKGVRPTPAIRVVSERLAGFSG